MNTEQALTKTDYLYRQLAARRRDIATNESYFRGDHKLVYATEAWAEEHSKRFRGFSDNWCGVVGSAPAERTAINGFRIGDTSEVLTNDEKALWVDWQTNEMPSQASQGVLMSTIAKRSHVLVWGDRDGNPVVTWEHPAQTIVEHDPVNWRVRPFGLKAWVDDDLEYATLYTPDVLWKWQRPRVAGMVVNGRTDSGLYVSADVAGLGAGWEPRTDDGDDVWPLPNPLKEVPLIEWANRPMLGGEPLSDIEGTRAMQDAINLLWAYLFTAADFASMPARVVLGQDPPKIPILDENGQKVGEKPVDIKELTRGRMLWLTGQQTKTDQWDAAKLDVFTQVINVAVKHVAAQTRTPIHYILGELGNVNGETLTATETPLNMKVLDSHLFYTPRARDVFRLMALVRDKTEVAEACRTGLVQWRNPETRSEAALADAALKDRSIGFPLAWIAEKRYGMSQTEVARLLEMVDDERNDPTLNRTLDALNTPPPNNAA